MKKNKYIVALVFILLFSTLIKAESNGDDGYNTSPPDITDLRLSSYSEISELYGVRPKEWNVRAISVQGYIYEFDKQGNIISINGQKKLQNGQAVSGYLMEPYAKYDNKPIWKGDLKVYYWVTRSNVNDKFPLLSTAFVQSFYTDVVCPAQIVAEGYSQKKSSYGYNNDTLFYFNGDCDKAIDKVINGRKYKTYPASNKIVQDQETNWLVQYFSDPITPMYDQNNKCVLYCDVKEANK